MCWDRSESWYVLRPFQWEFMQWFPNYGHCTNSICIVQVLARNTNSWAHIRPTESAVCFNKFPGDSDARSGQNTTCLHAFSGSQHWAGGISRALGEVVESRARLASSQVANEWVVCYAWVVKVGHKSNHKFFFLKIWMLSCLFSRKYSWT